jgi:pilus assembly protein CpaC
MFDVRTRLSNAKRPLALLLAAALVLSLPASVLAGVDDDKGVLVDVQSAQGGGQVQAPLYITLGKAEMVDLPGNVSDVLVADPTIIDVQAVQSNKLYVVGLNVGDTNLIVLDERGETVKRLDVHVKYDLQAIQSLVNELFPDESVKIGSIHDQILMTGTASTPEKASKIANIVGHYVSDLQDEDKSVDELISNLIDVRGEQQVMLQVKIIEATRSILKELGLETDLNDPNELSATTLFGTTPGSNQTNHGNFGAFATGAGIALSQDPTGIGRIIADTGIKGIGQIGLFLNALEEENLVHILAEPNLTAVSGEQAGFLAGGEFPVPVGRDQVGNLVIEFREFGVSLNFKPVVLSQDRISLQLNTEVSSLDFDEAIVLAGVTVPGLDVRRADTTVEIPSGGSLMIAGLLQSSAVKGMAGLPGIRNTPVLGDLVSSDSFQRDETELVVIITPYLVEPYAQTNRAEKVPKRVNGPLARTFASNIRKIYGIREDDEIFEGNEQFGYLLN